jgi:sec-independent protein translocase protein TatB
MFGMGFAEILIIAVIAILFLGPDKLPQAMVDIAKFFRSVKRTISSARESIEEELHISDMRQEALQYKKELTAASDELARLSDMSDVKREINDVKDAAKVTAADAEATKPLPKEPPKPEVITFEKKSKKSSPPTNESEPA